MEFVPRSSPSIAFALLIPPPPFFTILVKKYSLVMFWEREYNKKLLDKGMINIYFSYKWNLLVPVLLATIRTSFAGHSLRGTIALRVGAFFLPIIWKVPGS